MVPDGQPVPVTPVAVPAVPAPVPAVQAPPDLRSDVVPPSSPLLGREQEVDYVRSLLEGSSQRLVTLTGLGGVGKTRLAFAVAQASRSSYRDGVVVVSLAPVGEPDSVLPEVARVLGLAGVEAVDAGAAVTEHLRSREPAPGPRQPRAPAARRRVAEPAGGLPSRLTVLVTSRTVLRVRGEVQYQVPPLPLPDPDESDPVALARSAAVALFVERAGSVVAGYRLDGLDAANAAAIGAIRRRLAGLPLAIELAAARVRLMPSATMLVRLDQVMAGRRRPRPAPPPAHDAGGDHLERYDLLASEEQQLFRRLSVFAGGFTLEAVEGVAGDPPALGTLEALVEHSLVLPDADHPDVARYRMLEPIAQYADGLLVDEERLTTRAAHRLHFRALAGEL